MKKLTAAFILFSVLLLQPGCGEAVPYEAFSFESFAYMLEDENHWEVNTSVQVRGFEQREQNEKYTAHLTYNLDLVYPSGELVTGVVIDSKEFSFHEEVLDTQLEPQFVLETKESGIYKLTITVTDEFTGQTTTANSDFEIEFSGSEFSDSTAVEDTLPAAE